MGFNSDRVSRAAPHWLQNRALERATDWQAGQARDKASPHPSQNRASGRFTFSQRMQRKTGPKFLSAAASQNHLHG